MSSLWQEYSRMRPFEDGPPPAATAWGATHKKAFDRQLYCIEHLLRASEIAHHEIKREKEYKWAERQRIEALYQPKPRKEPDPPEPRDPIDWKALEGFVKTLYPGNPVCEICGNEANYKVGYDSHDGHWACINHYTLFYR